MAECIQPTSAFSAAAGNIWNIKDGWVAEAADNLHDDKRYIALDATDDNGVIRTIMHDCENDCDAVGSTYSRESDGNLKGRAPLIEDEEPPFACDATSASVTVFGATGAQSILNGTYTVRSDIQTPCAQFPGACRGFERFLFSGTGCVSLGISEIGGQLAFVDFIIAKLIVGPFLRSSNAPGPVLCSVHVPIPWLGLGAAHLLCASLPTGDDAHFRVNSFS